VAKSKSLKIKHLRSFSRCGKLEAGLGFFAAAGCVGGALASQSVVVGKRGPRKDV
jgi:hypothetical protein